MGIFSKKIMTGVVTFYGKKMAVFSYDTKVTDKETKEQLLAGLLIKYYAKILYNLGKGGVADELIRYTDKIIEQFNSSKPFYENQEGKLAIVISGINRKKILPSDLKLNPAEEEINDYLKGIAEKSVIENRKLGIVAAESIKKYEAEFFEKSQDIRYIKTSMSSGEETYYAPLSVVVFIQYIINNLAFENLAYFIIVLASANKFYKEIGDYSNIQSTTEAPKYAFMLTAQRFS